MSKNELFFVADPHQQRMWRKGQVLVWGRIVCGELRVGEHIVVYDADGQAEKVFCCAILKQNKKVTTAWRGEKVGLIVHCTVKKLVFVTANEFIPNRTLVLKVDTPADIAQTWKTSQKVKIVLPDYYCYTVEAEITEMKLNDDKQWLLTGSVLDCLRVPVNVVVEICSDEQRLLGWVTQLLA